MSLPPELLANEPFAMLRRIAFLGVKEHERELLDRLLEVTFSIGKIEGAKHMFACAHAADVIRAAKMQ